MNNWLTKSIIKLCKRRFSPNDRVRYFVETRKGKGKGVVLTPVYQTGTVINFDPINYRYEVLSDSGEIFSVHPRNLVRI